MRNASLQLHHRGPACLECRFLCAQEIGDKEAEIRAQQDAAAAAEAEQSGLEAKRNGLNDQRKELWRAENEAESATAKMKADKQKADKKVRAVLYHL